MRLFDLHCDTATAVYFENASFADNSFHVSMKKAEPYDKYVQLTAIYITERLTDREGWFFFERVYDKWRNELEKNGVSLIRSQKDLETFDSSAGKVGVVLTLEDARILEGKIERVRTLSDMGIRVITPLWGGETCIGGSHQSQNGLTPFGREAVDEMLSCGILPDVSHASFASADEILALCEKHGKTAIASHSDSYAVNPHTRNLTDERYLRIARRGGVAGVNLCLSHLSPTEDADISVVLSHIRHYHSLSPDGVAFGCDMDGTDIPGDIGDLSGLVRVADALRNAGFSEKEIEAIFWKNAYRFFVNNLPKES